MQAEICLRCAPRVNTAVTTAAAPVNQLHYQYTLRMSVSAQPRCDSVTAASGATENAGQENDGQKCNTQNALIDHWR